MKATILGTPWDSLPIAPGPARTEGIHVTSVIRDIGIKLGMMKDYSSSPSGWESGPTREVGFIFEEALSRAFGDRFGFRPEEMCIDGIYFSPDALIPTQDGAVELMESKATWSSSKTVEKEFLAGDGPKIWPWVQQTQAYCGALGLTVCHFLVLFINGDYTRSGPIFRHFRVEYAKEEVEAVWARLVKHSKTMGEKA